MKSYSNHSLSVVCLLQSLEEEEKMTPEQLAIKNVGKQVQTGIQFLLPAAC